MGRRNSYDLRSRPVRDFIGDDIDTAVPGNSDDRVERTKVYAHDAHRAGGFVFAVWLGLVREDGLGSSGATESEVRTSLEDGAEQVFELACV